MLPELGAMEVSGASHTTCSGGRPVVSQTIWQVTVPMPWPMQAAEVRIWTAPFSTWRVQRPVSGMPTPRPEFFMAQAMPALGLAS